MWEKSVPKEGYYFRRVLRDLNVGRKPVYVSDLYQDGLIEKIACPAITLQ